MPNPQVLIQSNPHAAWFERQTARKKRRTEKLAIESVAEAISLLGGRLPLSNKIMLGFTDGDCFAMADKRKIQFTAGGARLLVGKPKLFVGITAHELSHISDFKTNNNCNSMGLFNRYIAEGKADAVGAEIGGKDYSDVFCFELEKEEKTAVYTDIDSGSSQARARLRAQGDVYDIGLSIVGDVINAVGTDIFAIHREPVEFYSGVFKEVIMSRWREASVV